MFALGDPTTVPHGSEIGCDVHSAVVGRNESHKNDVLVCHGESIRYHIILFHGDVQDYKENMIKHRDNHRWSKYNIEDTAKNLQKRFRSACVWLIRPSRMHLNTFACYQNFVKSNMFGVPEYSSTQATALLQTACLFQSCIQAQFKDSLHEELYQKPVSILGFSKGCMVLNQMLHEWNSCPSSVHTHPFLKQFLPQIRDLCWLDSGNCGNSGAWVTEEECLISVPETVCFHVHVTPYQINDKFRPWIGEEHSTFVGHLKSHKCKLKEFVHFKDEEGSLDNHFKLLNTFDQGS